MNAKFLISMYLKIVSHSLSNIKNWVSNGLNMSKHSQFCQMAVDSKKWSNQKSSTYKIKPFKRCIKCPYLFELTSFLESRADILTKIFISFLVDLKAPKGHFEINWPLTKGVCKCSGKFWVLLSHFFSNYKIGLDLFLRLSKMHCLTFISKLFNLKSINLSKW